MIVQSDIAELKLEEIRKEFGIQDITINYRDDTLRVESGGKKFSALVSADDTAPSPAEFDAVIPLDYIMNAPAKVAGILLSRLGLNRRIFARKCQVRITGKKEALAFHSEFHLLDGLKAPYNLGLYHHDELVALASFSKGRRMNRLVKGKLSYELMRFSCRKGITVPGGLSRLVRTFCSDKKAGDIMSYVDRQLSEGNSFTRAGFIKAGTTPPVNFLVDRVTFRRIPFKNHGTEFDSEKFYRSSNLGNLKMIFTC